MCATPGCNQLTTRYRCPTHTTDAARQAHAHTSHIYSTKRWRILRARHLGVSPWCEATGCRSLATDVDHIVRINDGGDPWNPANLQSLCRSCHARKTAIETGLGRR